MHHTRVSSTEEAIRLGEPLLSMRIVRATLLEQKVTLAKKVEAFRSFSKPCFTSLLILFRPVQHAQVADQLFKLFGVYLHFQ